MEKRIETNLTDENLLIISKALASKTRIDILNYLTNHSYTVKELSELLNLPFTTVATNIDILEKAKLINCVFQTGTRGLIKLCSIANEDLLLTFKNPDKEKVNKTDVISLPIGSYTSIDVQPTCGIASKKGFIGKDDDIRTLYDPKRFEAEILWFSSGYVEYTIPLHKINTISSISITMELCSEAPFFREKFPSDITLSINGVELGVYTSPGDFGGRRGKFTPKWWPALSTQFGLLKTWQIDNYHTTVDNKEISTIKIKDLNITNNIAKLRIAVKPDAHNCGGINIFGSNFGDYPINIEIAISH